MTLLADRIVDLLAATCLMFAVALTAVYADEAFQVRTANQASDEIFGGNQSGMFLWKSAAPFCAPLRDAVEKNIRDKIQLMYTDTAQAHFFSGTCDSSCSLLDETRTLHHCTASLGSGQCRLYAAVRGKIIYDLAVSADGSNIADACDDR